MLLWDFIVPQDREVLDELPALPLAHGSPDTPDLAHLDAPVETSYPVEALKADRFAVKFPLAASDLCTSIIVRPEE